MPSTYTSSLRLVKQAVGENANTWGTIFNQQFADLVDTAISGYAAKALSDADTTLTASNGVADESRAMILKFTGTLTDTRNVVIPSVPKVYFIINSATEPLIIKTAGGTGVTIVNGQKRLIFCDGSEVFEPNVSIGDDPVVVPPGTTINDGDNNYYSIGYLGVPQISKSSNYTCILSDQGKHIYHPSADTTARIWTIPANSSVAYPVGTTITFVNDLDAGEITLSIASDTLILAGSGATGSRKLTAPANATALKIATTRWIVSGLGIS